MRENERAVTIPGDVRLEGVLHAPALEVLPVGVVVCHPHPMYGGEMNHPVVVAIARKLAERGLWALRFNFRGAGDSEGTAGEGLEAAGDIGAALAFLDREVGGGRGLAVAGYSFGATIALVNAAREQPSPARALALVGLPVRFPGLRLPNLMLIKERGLPVLAVSGEADEFGPPQLVAKALAPLGAGVRVATLAGADHSYAGHWDEVARQVAEFMLEKLGESGAEEVP